MLLGELRGYKRIVGILVIAIGAQSDQCNENERKCSHRHRPPPRPALQPTINEGQTHKKNSDDAGDDHDPDELCLPMPDLEPLEWRAIVPFRPRQELSVRGVCQRPEGNRSEIGCKPQRHNQQQRESQIHKQLAWIKTFSSLFWLNRTLADRPGCSGFAKQVDMNSHKKEN